MAGKDRERRLARAHYERQQQRRAEAHERARRRHTWIAAALVTVLVLGGVGYLGTAVGGDDETGSSTTPAPSASPSPSPTASAAAGCQYRPADSGGVEKVGTPPTRPASRPYKAVLDTNRGTIRLALDTASAPCTVGSFRFLAGKDYFDDSPCHRLTTESIFVLQCGDPLGSGQGGPGYEFDEENLPKPGGVTYPKGTVAMARTTQPGTNGSQFFLVHDDTTLPPDYTVFGQVTGGMNVLDDVAAAGTKDGGGDGPPKRDVVIRDVTVREQKA
ncbi:MAG: peptidylprolyl isomerase [Actinomycetes bacterium]